LRINYRSIASLTEIISSCFYRNEMVCRSQLHKANHGYYESPLFSQIPHPSMRNASNSQLLGQLANAGLIRNEVSGALLWRDVKGSVRRCPKTMSLYNDVEVHAASNLLMHLQRIVGSGRLLGLTPYKEQVGLTFSFIGSKCSTKICTKNFQASKMSMATAHIPGLRVRTVDECQGQESDYVVISLVRASNGQETIQSSSPMGFLSVPNRVNVMLSRGKLLVFIVGDLEHFSATHIQYWQKIVASCEVV
jgi:superfamily I DNA and/or RNA helicase